jgi:hypothetical protein
MNQENSFDADEVSVRRMFYIVIGIAAAVPVCWLLTAFVQGQLEAMGAATPSTYHFTFGSLLAAAAVVVLLLSRKTGRPRAKKTRCRAVNCFTLDFRP